MEWQDGGESRDIEDRRSQSGGGGFGGGLNPLMFLGLLRGGPIGIGIFILIVLFTVFRGHHFPSSNNSSPAPRAAVVGPASQQRDVQLISYVLDDAQNTWAQIFEASNKQYSHARLVLFRDRTYSGCGT